MNWNKLIAVIFSIICLILSAGMFLLSKEDVHLAYGALGFFAISLCLLWVSYAFFEKKQFTHKTIWFTVTAICVASTIFPVFWITVKISDARNSAIETNFRNTRVIDFQDQVLFSERKNPVGIRLSYTVIVPRTDLYFPEPSISGGNNRTSNLYFYRSTVKIDPLPRLERPGVSLVGHYDKDVSYKIIADLKPSFLSTDQKTGNQCVYFNTPDEENLVKNAEPQKLEVDIDGTSFNRYYGQRIHYLENNYNLKDFYDSTAKENIPRCVRF